MVDQLKIMLFILAVAAVCNGFDKEGFLQKHCKKDDYSASFRFDYPDCLICSDVQLSEEDEISFQEKSFDITDEKIIVFDGGNVGTVNSDFFKQFPNTQQMLFNNVSLSLKPSATIDENKILNTLSFIQSNVSEILNTNALHSLVGLKTFVMEGCNMTNTTIDQELLKMNKNIKDLTLNDIVIHPTPKNPALLKYVDDDALDGLENLEILYLSVDNMTEWAPQWFENKKKLNEVLLLGSWKTFPLALPSTITSLDMSFSQIQHVTNEDFQTLKKLKRFSMCHGILEVIDENAFDDLLNLESLFLNKNAIRSFTAGHLSNLSKLKLLGIGDNRISNLTFLNDLGFKKQVNETRDGYYERAETF